MKCGSCRDTDANQYKKIGPNDNLFAILKTLNANRTYNPKHAYFCDKCIAAATAELSHRLTLISNQNANSFTLDSSPSSARTGDSLNSSKDEFDIIVENKRVFSDTGTPLFAPKSTKRSNDTANRPKPCPKRFKKTGQLGTIREGLDRQDTSAARPNFTTSRNLPEQESSEALNLDNMGMSSPSLESGPSSNESKVANTSAQDRSAGNPNVPVPPSLEQQPIETTVTGLTERNSDSLSNKGTSRMDVNTSNSSFTVQDRGADSLGVPNDSLEVPGSNSPNDDVTTKEVEKRRTQPRRSASRTPPSERDVSESHRSTSKRSSKESVPSTSKERRTEPLPSTSGTRRTEPHRTATTTSTRVATTHDDSDTLSSHDGDSGTLAPAVKNPRPRQPVSGLPQNLQNFFRTPLNVNDYRRLDAG